MFAAGLLLFLAAILFIQTLVLPTNLTMPPAITQLKASLKTPQEQKSPKHGETATKPLWLDYAKKHPHTRESTETRAAGQRTQSLARKEGATGGKGEEVRLGFLDSWDPNSLDSLKTHGEHLTHLSPDWLRFNPDIETIEPDTITDAGVLELVEEKGLVLMPLLRNLGEGDIWMAEPVESLINGPASRQDRFIAHLVASLHELRAGGVILDWQQIDPSYRTNMNGFLSRLAETLHGARLELWLCVSTGRDMNSFDLDVLAHHVDRFVALLHDEHAELDPPGPIASRDFFSGWLSTLVNGYGTPSQWVISLATYGYDWTEGGKTATPIRFADAMALAHRSGQTGCAFHHSALNPTFVYQVDNDLHTVWFLDAVTFLNQLSAARTHHVGGIAVNKLGTEDPGIWDILGSLQGTMPSGDDLARLETIHLGDAIAHIGKGPLITVIDERSDGRRRLHFDRKNKPGAMASAIYEQFPRSLVLLHQGRGPEDGVALTFDDGPDSDWTPALLDILAAKQVKATFFLIGANMEKHPHLVQRIVAEGHMVGVHTYSHPNIARVSEERAHLELNATQRLLESITGRSTILFRPPYNADTNPHDPEELIPIKLAQDMGYTTVTEDIDPEDWSEPGVAVMVERIKLGRIHGGNVVLLHDAGGDRSQTVEALPRIIDYLQARGDRILPLPELLGVPAEQMLPMVPDHQQPLIRIISDGGFTAIHELTNFFWAFMLVATGLTVIKTLAVSWLAIRSRRPNRADDDGVAFSPPVSVLIAAYNEEKVIAATLHSVLNTIYAGPMEVIVVDDGSRDATAAVVDGLAAGDHRIRLIRQDNLGKARALRTGLASARHDFVVCLDADTQFTPHTIGHLIRPFADPAVGAVSGRARVGNPHTLIARFQSLEYTCGFNLDRRAYDRLNCITVVPGAVGAFRKSAVAAAGGISTETLAEDTDLTLALHLAEFTVRYAPQAVAWTEAPETVQAFAKQRFRWAFGTLQCLWKHRELLFSARAKGLGWFSLPSMWFFNLFLVAIGSIIDLLLIFSLVMNPTNVTLYVYFFIFLAADLVLAAVACLVEREPLAQIWLVLPMRFIYRPVLNVVVVRAILRALKGVWVGWGKLDRTASVTYRT